MAYNRSNFPEEYDVFMEKLDIPFTETDNVLRYQELYAKGEEQTEQEVEELGQLKTRLEQYLLTPEDINYFQDAMTNVQKFFKENTVDYVNNLQKETKDYTDKKQKETEIFVNDKQNSMGNFVKDKVDELSESQNLTLDTISQFKYRGIYKRDTQYKQWNTVKFRGNMYLALQDTLNNEPTSTNYWVRIADNGDKVKWRGTWSQVINYKHLDMVIYNKSVYICQVDNYDKIPNLEDEYWNIVIDNREQGKNKLYPNYKDGGFKISHNMEGYPDVKAIFTNTYGHGGYGMFGIRNEYEVKNIVEYIDSNTLKVFLVEEFKGIPKVEKQKEGVYFIQYQNEDYPLKIYLK